MNITVQDNRGNSCAVVYSENVIIKDTASMLDFLMSVYNETKCHSIGINKQAIIEDFFDLKTKIAGEALQKVVTYNFKLAIIGNFAKYKSNALRDFIFECNNGTSIFFVGSEREAVEKLTMNT